MKYDLEYSWLLEDRRLKVRATVLCYNLKGTAKGRKIGLIFGFLGYRVRHVEKEEYLLPVGEVAEGRTTESINEEAGVKTKEIEAVFQEEMLLMCPVQILSAHHLSLQMYNLHVRHTHHIL